MTKTTSSGKIRTLIDWRILKGRLFAFACVSGLAVVCGSGLVSQIAFAAGGTIHVDKQISSSSCTNYNPSTRACGSGTDTAYKTITGASAAATPGTTVLIHGGSYAEPLIPQTSGAPDQYITFKNYSNEQVFLGGETAIVLSHRRYIWIEGLRVEDRLWLESNNSDASFANTFQNRNYNVIKGCVFKRSTASGTTGNIRFVRSHNNRLLNNTIEDGVDNVLLIDSERNLVEGNTITTGHHSLFGVRCADYNVIRNNYFSNPLQKIGEVYDCGVDTHAVPNSFDSTKHNVIENNVFADASESYSLSDGNGIQYSGQEGILRRNVFYNCNVGLAMQRYEDEALYNVNNRIYHNVFYNNDGPGISFGAGVLNNVFKNNSLFANKGCIGDCGTTSPGQVTYLENPAGGPFWEATLFSSNDIFYQQPGQPVIESAFGSGLSIADFNAQVKQVFLNTREVNPQFVNAASLDFHLQSTSPLIDAGESLTRTAEAKSASTSMRVEDAAYFYDGYGIVGLEGDLIQLQGGTSTARVTAVDYATKTLTLDRPLSWTAGQGVSLQFGGNAPDIGVFETNVSTPLALPSAPTNLRVQ